MASFRVSVFKNIWPRAAVAFGVTMDRAEGMDKAYARILEKLGIEHKLEAPSLQTCRCISFSGSTYTEVEYNDLQANDSIIFVLPGEELRTGPPSVPQPLAQEPGVWNFRLPLVKLCLVNVILACSRCRNLGTTRSPHHGMVG
jgi:hypothetical protein